MNKEEFCAKVQLSKSDVEDINSAYDIIVRAVEEDNLSSDEYRQLSILISGNRICLIKYVENKFVFEHGKRGKKFIDAFTGVEHTA